MKATITVTVDIRDGYNREDPRDVLHSDLMAEAVRDLSRGTNGWFTNRLHATGHDRTQVYVSSASWEIAK